MKKQSGFTALTALLLLLIVGIIGVVGWYVYDKNYKKQSSHTNSYSTPTNTQKTSPTPDPTSDWQTVTSNDKSFSFKMPKEWVYLKASDCPKSMDTQTIYIGPSQQYLAKCDSDATGSASFYVANDNTNASPPNLNSGDKASASIYKSATYKDTTVDGVKGYKLSLETNENDVLTPNSKITTYEFYSKNKSFTASYQQRSGEPDNLSTFEQIVQTWKF